MHINTALYATDQNWSDSPILEKTLDEGFRSSGIMRVSGHFPESGFPNDKTPNGFFLNTVFSNITFTE